MLIAGEVGKPHGISGEVYVVRISDDPTRFDPGALLIHADGRELIIEDSRGPKGSRLLVKFEGVDTREQAEALRGALYVAGSELRTLEQGEYWEHELIGCVVVDRSGNEIGDVIRVVAGAAQDLLEVSTVGGETRLIPYVDEIVVEVDPRARRVVVDPPPGLLE